MVHVESLLWCGDFIRRKDNGREVILVNFYVGSSRSRKVAAKCVAWVVYVDGAESRKGVKYSFIERGRRPLGERARAHLSNHANRIFGRDLFSYLDVYPSLQAITQGIKGFP